MAYKDPKFSLYRSKDGAIQVEFVQVYLNH